MNKKKKTSFLDYLKAEHLYEEDEYVPDIVEEVKIKTDDDDIDEDDDEDWGDDDYEEEEEEDEEEEWFDDDDVNFCR